MAKLNDPIAVVDLLILRVIDRKEQGVDLHQIADGGRPFGSLAVKSLK